MKKIIYILAIIGAFTFSSCESEVSFLELAGQQGFVFTGTTQNIQEYIGQEAYDKITQVLQIPLNTGDEPPILNGNFLLWRAYQESNIEDPTDVGITDLYIHVNLKQQNNEDLTIDYDGYFFTDGGDGVPRSGDEIEGPHEFGIGTSFVSGSANGKFTIFTRSQVYEGRVDVIAISGTRTADGIDDLQYAYVYFDNGDPETGNIIGGIRWRDDDGFSENFVWP